MRVPPTPPAPVDAPTLRRTLAWVLWWSPAWMPLPLATHLALAGLEPARAEQRRLRAEEPVVVERRDATADRLLELELRARAWNDPIYLERYRLNRLAEESAAREGSPAEGGGTRPR